MKKIIDILIKKPTVISILGIAVLVIGIPSGIYGLTLKGGASLGGALILLGVGFTSIIFLIDRVIVNVINIKTLNIIESILLLVGLSFCLYQERKVEIDVMQNTNYFVLIENNGNFKESELKYKFPFNRRLIANSRNATINSISDNFHQIDLNPPKEWGSYIMTSKTVDQIKVQFYYKFDSEIKREAIDSLVRKEMKSVANNAYGGQAG